MRFVNSASFPVWFTCAFPSCTWRGVCTTEVRIRERKGTCARERKGALGVMLHGVWKNFVTTVHTLP